jgi:hypothetical protein
LLNSTGSFSKKEGKTVKRILASLSAALVLAIVVQARPASADSLYFSSSGGADTLTQGQSTVFNVSLTNSTSNTIYLGGLSVAPYLLQGDSSDSITVTQANNLCPFHGGLAGNSACTFQLDVFAPNSTDATDPDSGYWFIQLSTGGGNQYGGFSATSGLGITVLDPVPVSPVPEPSGLLLFGTGLLAAAMLAMLRRRAAYGRRGCA